MITGRTRVVALLGDPVTHSLSPVFQNAAIRALDLDAVYIPLACKTDQLPDVLAALTTAGAAGNVTVPHKAAVARLLDHATPAVHATGACNTFWAEQGILYGDNTDVAGVIAAVEPLCPPRAASVLLLGAGGAAAAAAYALREAGAARVLILNRTADRAQALAERIDPAGRVVQVVASADRPDDADFDLVINATSLGLHDDDPLPIPFDHVRARAALDLVYAAGRTTAWVRAAREAGIPAADGTGMLLAQGAAAFQLWFRTPAPLDVMRAALEGTIPR